MERLAARDVIAGLVFAAFGVAGLVIGRGLEMGSAEEMGTGYVPRLMSWLLVGLGAFIALTGLRHGMAARVERITLRPLLMVSLAVLVFAASLERLGAFIAVIAAVVIASFAGSERGSAMSIVMTALVLAIGVVALFVWGLGLPVPALPRF